MHAIKFTSNSKGRGRKRRRPAKVILIQYNGDHLSNRWRHWNGKDKTQNGKLPWDQWAVDIFGREFCETIYYNRATHSDDYLREEILNLLEKNGDKF